MSDGTYQSSDSETSSNSSNDDVPPLSHVALLHSLTLGLETLKPLLNRRALHDSAFTGRHRLDEWQRRHEGGMHAFLGVEPPSFNHLLFELETHGNLRPSRFVQSDEKLAIFLYICRNACGVRNAGEAFQRSLETTANSFHDVLYCMTSPAFYYRFVRFPTAQDPPSSVIMDDPRFAKYFERCIGAIDGTHIPAHPPVAEASTYRTRKGALTMNVLAAASFDLKFIYILAGWEGSAHDGKVWAEALASDLVVPPGRFLLADAGFSTCRQLLVPFRGTRYHLQEWAKSKARPMTAKELYNLRHSSARNVIERIFGVAKRRWAILDEGCEYDIQTQARVVYGVAVLHNMLRDFEYPTPEAIPTDAQLRRDALTEGLSRTVEDDLDDTLSAAYRPPTGPREGFTAERNAAEQWRSDVAQSMWADWEKARQERTRRRQR